MAFRQRQRHQPSSTKQRICELCGCMVTGGDSQWGMHTAGIQHRRNAASQRMFGEPGHLVVSAFEPTDQLTTEAAAAAAGSSSRRSRIQQQQQQALSPWQQQHLQELTRLQAAVRKQLAAQVGISKVYRDAVESFDLDALEVSCRSVRENIACQAVAPRVARQAGNEVGRELQALQQQQQQQVQQGQQQLRQQEQSQPPPMPPPPQQQQQQQEEDKFQPPTCVRVPLQWPADAAVLSLCDRGLQRLDLTVPYDTFSCVSAATTAALAAYLSGLTANSILTHLSLLFSCSDYNHLVGQNPGCFAKANQQLWGPVLRVLREALEFNVTLQELTLAAFPAQFQADDLAALQTALATGRSRLRTALLMGTHKQLGAGSPLQQMPVEVLARVLDQAVPRQPCVLRLELPPQLLQHSSSEEDDSSDSDSDSDSSDNESGSSGSDSDDGGSSDEGSSGEDASDAE